jgi:hypothetical protein
VLRVQADEAIGRGHGFLVVVVAVVRVDQFQLRLLGVGAEGVAGLEQLQVLDREVEVAAVEVLARGVVECALALVRRHLILLAEHGAAGQGGGQHHDEHGMEQSHRGSA